MVARIAQGRRLRNRSFAEMASQWVRDGASGSLVRGCATAILALTIVLSGCSDPPPAAPISQSPPKSYSVRIESLATLLPKRRTHVAVAGDGTIFYVQEHPRGEDVMFTIPPGGIAQATNLTSQRIAAALGRREGVSGNIQSVAVDPSGRIFFCFAGGTRRTNLSCFGVFSPEDGNVRILADSAKIAAASGMGDSIELARGTVCIGGGNLWLTFHHTAMAAVFRFQLSLLDRGGDLQLIPAFYSLETPFGRADLSREEISFAAHPSGDLFVTDRYSGSIWQVDPLGRAKLVENLVGAPAIVATAGADASGRFATLLNDGDAIVPRLEGHTDPILLGAIIPIFLLHRGEETLHMGREMFETSSGFATYTISLEQLVADAKPDQWIGYDRTSGELLRLRLIPVN